MNKLFWEKVQYPVFPVFLLFLFTSFIHGCSRDVPVDKNVVATVNHESIKLEDFQANLALRSKQNPSYKITSEEINEQMDTVIDRRLMIQEAMRMGLAENKDFVRTIQSFWEQTLIRELIAAKSREWESRLFVTEREVEDYYEKMKYRITLKHKRAKNETEAHNILETARQGNITDWKTLGPLSYDDLVVLSLHKTYSMSEGMSEVLKDEKGFLVISIAKKESMDLPPMEELHDHLKRNLMRKKKTDALAAWLRDERDNAVIEINSRLLETSFDVESSENRTDHSGRDGG
jgi:hypothetical protein